LDDQAVAAASDFDHHPRVRRRDARSARAIEADTVAHCGPTLISEFARYGHRWAATYELRRLKFRGQPPLRCATHMMA
jgi:hypothetical protein